ncbi:hypothetical protein NM208_g3973 [Fusarium decemcellulare]|uniref:Uncharacterized protein n=1 Tax=Fusarium decemcellulare TaxID=57161 RepID=A0ACC1SMG3_9HYPO|nr:hypothetical protein NM208_g3973 [Fusarium decemcellulare]
MLNMGLFHGWVFRISQSRPNVRRKRTKVLGPIATTGKDLDSDNRLILEEQSGHYRPLVLSSKQNRQSSLKATRLRKPSSKKQPRPFILNHVCQCSGTHHGPIGFADCAAWTVAQPLDNCELLATSNKIPLAQLVRHNPSLANNCSTTAGYSYCIDKVLRVKSNEKHNELRVRADGSKAQRMPEVIEYLFLRRAISALPTIIEHWNTRFTPMFRAIPYADFGDYLVRSRDGMWYYVHVSTAELAEHIACNLELFNDKVAKWKGLSASPMTCECWGDECCRSDEVCDNSELKRLKRSPSMANRRYGTLELPDGHHSELVPRAADYPWTSSRDGVGYSGTYPLIANPGPSDYSFEDPMWQEVFGMSLVDDCTLTFIRDSNYKEIKEYLEAGGSGADIAKYAHVEHWVEKNMIAKFTADVIAQTLPSGAAFQTAASIHLDFFVKYMTTEQLDLQNVPTVPGADNVLKPKDRLMHALGSKKNSKGFMLLQGSINNLKEGILKGDDPVAKRKIAKALKENPRLFLTRLRMVFGSIGYINEATALEKGEATLKAIRWELYQYQQAWNKANGQNADLVAAWDEWYLNYMKTRLDAARTWLITWATTGRDFWKDKTDKDSKTATRVCQVYLNRAKGLGGFNNHGYPQGTPTPPPFFT